MSKFLRLILSLTVLGFTGCSSIGDYLSIARERGMSREYLDVLKQWTRKETVYSQFETRVIISATYKGRAFTKAYLKEYGRIYGLTAAEREKRESLQAESASEYREFIFYAYLPEKNDNDFDRQDSIWKIVLTNEKGEKFAPLEVRKLEKITPLIEDFYPYINKYYGSCYHLKFPPGASTAPEGGPDKPFQLVFASVLGKATLEWK